MKRYMPLLVAVYVSATGIFFLLASVFKTRIASSAGNGKVILLVMSIGFLLADKNAGPFKLEIEWIKAVRGAADE